MVAARALDLRRRVPKTSVGKFDKKVLRARYDEGELEVVMLDSWSRSRCLADEVADLERRVSDAIFDAVRAQLRDGDADEAKELERRLSKVRRSLQKAEMLLRGPDE